LGLRLPERQLARQNLEPQRVTRKIFWNKGLEGRNGPFLWVDSFQFFSSSFCKIFNSLMLRLSDRRLPRQNIEPEGLTSKIFQNKELAAGFWLPDRVGFRKILILLYLRFERCRPCRQNIPSEGLRDDPRGGATISIQASGQNAGESDLGEFSCTGPIVSF
jgi:hypothetical protein